MQTQENEESLKTPELLAPAGNWDCARAAVEAGADAIYFGVERLNARMRADNFKLSDLPQLMSFLHSRSVKGYLTLNTLVFENELEAAAEMLTQVIEAGVDAAIVQDIGVCRLIRQLSRDFPIHASTQMTITSAAGIRFASELGCRLVVMARECSIGELEQIEREMTDLAAEDPRIHLPLEVFVHGALCVAYSGQCLTSESLGGRSANRGECAQACRMTYDLYRDGEALDLGDRRYLLSPQDLLGLEAIPELVAAGVRSFKIEGRLKSPEYVANVTSAYRRAIDLVMDSGGNDNGEGTEAGMGALLGESQYDLEMAFSRGLYTGWLRGIDNQRLVHARFGKKRGVFVGRVQQVGRRGLILKVEAGAALKEGDGLVIDQGRPDQGEQGGRVQVLKPARSRSGAKSVMRSKESRAFKGERESLIEVGFRPGNIDFKRVREGDRVWKTSDLEFERRWKRVAASEKPLVRRGLRFRVGGGVGEPMRLEVIDDQGNQTACESTMPMEEARSRPLSDEVLRQQLGRLGGTPFDLAELENDLNGDVMLPVSELNRLRREAIERLQTLRSRRQRWDLNAEFEIPSKKSETEGERLVDPEFVVLIRKIDQLRPTLEAGIRSIYCDFEDPKLYREAVRLYRALIDAEEQGRGGAAAQDSEAGIFVAPPRIHKSGEGWILKQVQSCEPDGFLIRNFDHLEFFKGCRIRGDFSFNVANSLTADYLMGNHGFERLTVSYDLNADQLEGLFQGAPSHWFEVTLHQHMPMFHMEHCVFCAFLSEGKDYRDCGRPCDHHEVELQDRVGQRHFLKADVGCRNTLFNGRAQTGAEYFDRFVSLGVKRFRIEFLNESPEGITQTIRRYQRLRSGQITGEALWQELKLMNQLGVTRGSLEH